MQPLWPLAKVSLAGCIVLTEVGSFKKNMAETILLVSSCDISSPPKVDRRFPPELEEEAVKLRLRMCVFPTFADN